jgi:hypothetical protein
MDALANDGQKGESARRDSVTSSDAAPVASSEMPAPSGTAAASESPALALGLLPQAASAVAAMRRKALESCMVKVSNSEEG